MPEEAPTPKTARTGTAARAKTKRAAGTGKSKRASGQAKPEVTPRELVLIVSRVAADFEALLKTKTPPLSLSQWAMLETLSQDGAMRPSQIGRKLGFSRQLIRQATKKLTSSELVVKETPEEGKKAVGLTISDAGRKALAEIGTATDAMAESLKADKRGGSVNQAVRMLKGLSAAMPKNTASRGKGRKKKAEATEADAAATATEETTVEA